MIERCDERAITWARARCEPPMAGSMRDELESPGPGATEGDRSAGMLDLRSWRASLREEMSRTIHEGPWSRALLGVACVHLAIFSACQIVYDPEIQADLRHPLLWGVELFAVLAVMRGIMGRGWIVRSPAINLVAKLWTTFLILSFNLVSLNFLTGLDHIWFRPVWGTLSTFLFASLAWLFTPWFFVPAVQMYFTGMLMVKFPAWSNLTYGVSWWLALAGVAFSMRRRDLPGPSLIRALPAPSAVGTA